MPNTRVRALGPTSARCVAKCFCDARFVAAESLSGLAVHITTDTSGLFRNHFLTEPRVFGVSMRYISACSASALRGVQ